MKIKKRRKSKQKNENEINDISENKLVGKKRKKEKKPNPKKNDMPELILSSNSQKPKKKRKNSSNKKSSVNPDSLKKEDNSNNTLKFFSKTEKNDKINNFNFFPPFNISNQKDLKNIFFPFSITKSNKSCKQDDFSFSNKYNISNDYIEPSLQKVQLLPMNYDNIYFLHQKNKNSIISDMSYDNNLSNINSKNDNTYKNYSINGNNISIKSFEEKAENKKDNEKPVIINIDVINNQDFANAFINGNTLEPNDKSQYNTSIYNKNNNNLNIFNPSSPPSVRNYWK
jgi:hypothetical protein